MAQDEQIKRIAQQLAAIRDANKMALTQLEYARVGINQLLKQLGCEPGRENMKALFPQGDNGAACGPENLDAGD